MPQSLDLKLLERIPLKNGLELFFYDRSRTVAGDRAQVRLLVRVPIKPDLSHFEPMEDAVQAHSEFTSRFGSQLYFEQEKTRNFVDLREAPAVIEQLKDDFLRINKTYLSRSDFDGRFVRKKYLDWKRGGFQVD